MRKFWSNLAVPIRVAAVFAIVGGAWILASDAVVWRIAPDLASLSTFQTIKGWFFILATAIFLYFLSRNGVRELEENRRELNSIFDNAAIGIFQTTRDGKFIRANQAMVNILGYDTFEEMQKSVDDIAAQIYVDPKKRIDSLEKLEHTDSSQEVEAQLKKKNGETIHTIITFRKVVGYESGREFYEGFVQDVTDRKIAEEALYESESMVQRIFSHLPDATFVVDMDGTVIAWNKSCEELTGVPREEMLGRSTPECSTAFYKKKRPLLVDLVIGKVPISKKLYSLVYRKGDAFVAENFAELLGEDGVYLWGIASPIYNAHGKMVGAIESVRDITQKKKAEQEVATLNEDLELLVAKRTSQLEMANKELEAFTYSVSHDLRAPLRSINGFAEIVLDAESNRLEKESVEHLERIVRSTVKMRELINDLLEFSRATNSELDKQQINLSAIAENIVKDFRAQEPERRVQVDIEPDIRLEADARLVKVAMENLLGNAWKFTRQTRDPKISLRKKRVGAKTVVSVSDNGVGFDQEYAEKIFMPFERLHTAREFAGSGIGLATVQRIVSRHDGEIWAHAEPGKGAEFCFTFEHADEGLKPRLFESCPGEQVEEKDHMQTALPNEREE